MRRRSILGALLLALTASLAAEAQQAAKVARIGYLALNLAAAPYLPEAFRLACQASIESADRDVEFAIIRRRMHILEATGETPADIDPAVTVE
jgi:hypothetical protein